MTTTDGTSFEFNTVMCLLCCAPTGLFFCLAAGDGRAKKLPPGTQQQQGRRRSRAWKKNGGPRF